MPMPRAIAFAVKEVKEAIPAIVFFAIGFNLIELTTQLLLDPYRVQFANYTVATLAALLVGKAVLIADALPFFRRFDDEPLIQPVLFKTGIYWLVVALLRILEQMIEFLTHGNKLRDVPEYLLVHFSWSRFAAIQIWSFILFLMYATVAELVDLFGRRAIMKSFFASGSPQLKRNRHQRVRTFVRLIRLTESHTLGELRDPNTEAHAAMFGLVNEISLRNPDGSRDR